MTEIRNATVESVTLNDGDRGILTCWLTLDYGGMSQGFGGYTLYLPEHFSHHKQAMQHNFAGHFIWRVMQIVDVTDWSRIKGKTLRAKIEGNLCVAIGHITKDDWFNPREDFAKWKDAQ